MQQPSEALILGIDTTGPVDSVALARGEHIVASLSLRQPPLSSRPLLRLIDVLCMQAQCALDEVTALAVNVGPGSFTGLRIGLATAQGLAVAYGKSLIGCTAFEALLALVPQWQGALCPVVQARKGEVYAALYHMERDGDRLTVEEKRPGMVVTPDALCAMIHERTLFLGSGVTAYRAALTAALGSDAVCLDLVEASTGLAASVARWGAARGQQEDDPWRVRPYYIRPADARQPRIAANAAGVAASVVTPRRGGMTR
jgi:tRNA threonylcarbamoyladenosine biosynthesis protein TsaB